MMAAAVEKGIEVVVYNLLCAPYNGPLSPAARELHIRWGDPGDITGLRLDEDAKALSHLGVQRMMGDQHDLIYRIDRHGEWLYPNMEDIMGERNGADEALVDHYLEKIRGLFEPDKVKVYAPLGIGGHIDHQITFDIGNKLLRVGFDVAFYEDLPYALKTEWRVTRLGELEGIVSGVELFSLDCLEEKLAALEFYASQITELFEDVENMRTWLTEWALKMSGRADRGGEMIYRFH